MSSGRYKRSRCPVVFALDIFGDRWTLIVVRDMVFRGLSTYSEFLNAGESIATNILADRLKRLETAGIVSRFRDTDQGARFRYQLSEKGLELVPVLVEMMRWSSRNDPDSPIPKELRHRLEKEPQTLAEEFVQRARTSRSTIT